MAEPGGVDKQKMKQILVPALAVGAIVILVGLVIYVSDAAGPPKMPCDGSDGSADDSGLKELNAGVKYRDLKVGAGETCAPGSDVKVHYVGWLTDGTEFDSSRRRNEPATFSLDRVVAGWSEGIPGMKVGGVRKLVVAPAKGYGSQEKGKIPPNSTLIFEVELLEVKAPAAPPRSRRDPPPADLSKLSDGTAPEADDPNLQPLGAAGLKCRDIKVGDGPVCPDGATVLMDYTGWLSTGGKYFDSSWKPGSDGPLNMSLGRLIKGWQQGVPGMKVGGVRKLVIPPDLGYGAGGQGAIPGGATLVFEIELLGFK